MLLLLFWFGGCGVHWVEELVGGALVMVVVLSDVNWDKVG